MEKSKRNLGITLVALVVTIIILLILAGITISQLANNGLFDKSKQAKEQYQNAQNYEETQIAKYSNEIDSYVDGNSRDTVTIPKDEYEILKNANSYSTTEKVVGKWIDGKPLYQITLNNLNVSVTKSNSETDEWKEICNIPNLSKCISLKLFADYGTDFVEVFAGEINSANGKLYAHMFNSSRTITHATIQYTKTID